MTHLCIIRTILLYTHTCFRSPSKKTPTKSSSIQRHPSRIHSNQTPKCSQTSASSFTLAEASAWAMAAVACDWHQQKTGNGTNRFSSVLGDVTLGNSVKAKRRGGCVFCFMRGFWRGPNFRETTNLKKTARRKYMKILSKKSTKPQNNLSNKKQKKHHHSQSSRKCTEWLGGCFGAGASASSFIFTATLASFKATATVACRLAVHRVCPTPSNIETPLLLKRLDRVHFYVCFSYDFISFSPLCGSCPFFCRTLHDLSFTVRF